MFGGGEISIASTILPIFAIIGLGYGAVRFGAFPKEAIPNMGRFVVSYCLPALVFSTVATSPIGEVLDPHYVILYALGSMLSFWLIFVLYRLLAGETAVAATGNGLGVSVSNSAFVGAPVLIAVYGTLPANAFTMNVLVENVLILPMVLVLFEIARSRRHGTRGLSVLLPVASNLIRNPILLALAAGLACNLLGIQLAEPVERSIGFLVSAATGVALFVIGGSLVGTLWSGQMGSILGVTAGKLLLHPLLVALLIWLAPPFDPELQRIAILSAAMPMLSIYPVLAGRYHSDNAYSAILMVATLMSMLTLSVWLLILY